MILIGIPCFDRANLLEECVRGVSPELNEDVRVLLTYGQNVDPQVKEFIETSRYEYIEAPGRCVSNNLNTLLSCRHEDEHFIRLDSDIGVWPVGWVQTLVDTLKSDVGFVGGYWTNPSATYIKKSKRKRTHLRPKGVQAAVQWYGPCGVHLMNAAMINQLGPYLEMVSQLRCHEDVDYFSRAYATGWRILYNNNVHYKTLGEPRVDGYKVFEPDVSETIRQRRRDLGCEE